MERRRREGESRVPGVGGGRERVGYPELEEGGPTSQQKQKKQVRAGMGLYLEQRREGLYRDDPNPNPNPKPNPNPNPNPKH